MEITKDQLSLYNFTHNEIQIPKWFILILLLTITPIGMIFMAFDNRYHSWFPLLLWIYAPPLFIFYFQIIYFLPHSMSLYDSFKETFPVVQVYITLTFAAVALAGQVVYGFILKRRFYKYHSLPRRMLWIAIAFPYVNWIILGYTLFITILRPMYEIVAGIK